MSTKEALLQILAKTEEEFISGQKLADELGVSRTAVWKAVQSLKEEGYQIESVPNKGHRLAPHQDRLSAALISRELAGQGPMLPVFVYDEVDSTNNEAKRRLQMQPDGRDFLVVADRQTAGRGRLGRSFYSPAETGLYMSLGLGSLPPFVDGTLITTAAAVAVAKAIENLTPHKPGIKWVNDVYLGPHKVAGILTEGVFDLESHQIQSIVLGIGLNIRQPETGMPSGLDTIAGTLYQKEAASITRNEWAAAILQEFYRILPETGSRRYLEDYRQRCFVLGKKVRYQENNRLQEAKAVAVDDDGGLVIETADGRQRTLTYGEISVRLAEQPDE